MDEKKDIVYNIWKWFGWRGIVFHLVRLMTKLLSPSAPPCPCLRVPIPNPTVKYRYAYSHRGQLRVRCSDNSDEEKEKEKKKKKEKRLSQQSSWEAQDAEGRDYLYRLGKEADNMNIAVGQRAGVIDSLFAGNFLGKDCNSNAIPLFSRSTFFSINNNQTSPPPFVFCFVLQRTLSLIIVKKWRGPFNTFRAIITSLLSSWYSTFLSNHIYSNFILSLNFHFSASLRFSFFFFFFSQDKVGKFSENDPLW